MNRWRDQSWIDADWPAPAGVRAGCSTRIGGCSQGEYAGLNLAHHVGDAEAAVAANRKLLAQSLGLPSEPVWLDQVHGTRCLDLDQPGSGRVADAALSRQGRVCAVMTADCLPILLCSRDGAVVAAVHAGWRGLQAGVIEVTVEQMRIAGKDLLAWLGPAIGPAAFEVGEEVRDAFLAQDQAAASCFSATQRRGKYLANLPELARQRLRGLGLNAIYGGAYCTVSEPGSFYSFRRDQRCGRMVSLIWRSK